MATDHPPQPSDEPSKPKISGWKPIPWQKPLWLRKPLWLWAAAGVCLLFVMVILWNVVKFSKKEGKGGTAVAVATAEKGDIPVYLDGLGSVTAFYSVIVRSRVDGQLMSVAFGEGHEVKKGEALAEIDPRPFQAALEQAQGLLVKDQALLANAQLDLKRYRDLLSQNAIPKQQLDTQSALVHQYEGAVKTDQGAVQSARLQIIYSHITSPIDGRVGLRLVDPGNMVHANDTNGLLVITQLHPINVVFTLPEDSIPQVMSKWNQGGDLTVEAFNRDKSQKLATGKLLTVDNEIDPATGTLKLKAVFENKDNILFPNQFVNVRLLLETKQDQTLIPAAAVQLGSQGSFVYVVGADHKVEMRPVKVALTEGTNASIETGLQAGEKVVTDGADKLQPGALANVQASNNPASEGGNAAPKADHRKP